MGRRATTVEDVGAGWEEIGPGAGWGVDGIVGEGSGGGGDAVFGGADVCGGGECAGDIGGGGAEAGGSGTGEIARAVGLRRGVMAPAELAGVLAVNGVEKAPASVVAGIGMGMGVGGKAAVIAKMAGKLLLWGQVKTAAAVGGVMVVTGVLAAVTVVQMRGLGVAAGKPGAGGSAGDDGCGGDCGG